MRPAAAPNAPRIEYHTAAGGPVLGLGTPRPRLSWSVPSAQAGYTQTAYEIEVSRESGIQRYRVQNAEQVLVPWPTDPLRSRERAEVRVRVAEQEVWPSVNYVMGATYYDAGQRFRDPRLRRQGIQLGAAVSTQIWRVEEKGFQFDAPLGWNQSRTDHYDYPAFESDLAVWDLINAIQPVHIPTPQRG